MKLLRKILGFLSTANSFISNTGLWLAATLIGAMAILIGVQVFFRYVLNNSLSWVEDMSLMLLVWSAFLIVPAAYQRSAHVGIDLIINMLSPRFRFVAQFLSGALVIALSLYFIPIAWEFTTQSSTMANAVPIQMKYVYGIMPVMFALLIPVAIELEIRALLGLIYPDDIEATFPTSKGVS